MARKVSVSAQDVKDSKGQAFGPIPEGKYLVNIYGVEDGEYKKGDNKGKDNINVQFQIAEGQPKANARVFQTIGLFPTWASGKNNYTFFQFFKAVGVVFPEDGGDLELPDNDELLGEQVVLDLKVKPDDYKYRQAFQAWEASGSQGDAPVAEDFKRNEIGSILPADGFEATDASGAEAVGDEFAL